MAHGRRKKSKAKKKKPRKNSRRSRAAKKAYKKSKLYRLNQKRKKDAKRKSKGHGRRTHGGKHKKGHGKRKGHGRHGGRRKKKWTKAQIAAARAKFRAGPGREDRRRDRSRKQRPLGPQALARRAAKAGGGLSAAQKSNLAAMRERLAAARAQGWFPGRVSVPA